MGFVLKGTIVNGAAIIVGGLLGVLLGGRIRRESKALIMQGIALAVLVIGMQMALQMQNAVADHFQFGSGRHSGRNYWS